MFDRNASIMRRKGVKVLTIALNVATPSMDNKEVVMRKYLVVVCLLVNHMAYAAINVAGTYECRWPDAVSGKTIKGLIILKKTGQTYTMKSGYDDQSSYHGTGIYDEKKHRFVLVYQNPKDLKDAGVSTTEFDESRNTVWTWADMNSAKVEHTYCVKKG